jgi:NAD(P)-dependent dehydrogenase (short-subunit alcohol dehydrogenase family)
MMNKKNWLITGISGGLGRALAKKVIAQGDYAFATFRKESMAEVQKDIDDWKAISSKTNFDS